VLGVPGVTVLLLKLLLVDGWLRMLRGRCGLCACACGCAAPCSGGPAARRGSEDDDDEARPRCVGVPNEGPGASLPKALGVRAPLVLDECARCAGYGDDVDAELEACAAPCCCCCAAEAPEPEPEPEPSAALCCACAAAAATAERVSGGVSTASPRRRPPPRAAASSRGSQRATVPPPPRPGCSCRCGRPSTG